MDSISFFKKLESLNKKFNENSIEENKLNEKINKYANKIIENLKNNRSEENYRTESIILNSYSKEMKVKLTNAICEKLLDFNFIENEPSVNRKEILTKLRNNGDYYALYLYKSTPEQQKDTLDHFIAILMNNTNRHKQLDFTFDAIIQQYTSMPLETQQQLLQNLERMDEKFPILDFSILFGDLSKCNNLDEFSIRNEKIENALLQDQLFNIYPKELQLLNLLDSKETMSIIEKFTNSRYNSIFKFILDDQDLLLKLINSTKTLIEGNNFDFIENETNPDRQAILKRLRENEDYYAIFMYINGGNQQRNILDSLITTLIDNTNRHQKANFKFDTILRHFTRGIMDDQEYYCSKILEINRRIPNMDIALLFEKLELPILPKFARPDQPGYLNSTFINQYRKIIDLIDRFDNNTYPQELNLLNLCSFNEQINHLYQFIKGPKNESILEYIFNNKDLSNQFLEKIEKYFNDPNNGLLKRIISTDDALYKFFIQLFKYEQYNQYVHINNKIKEIFIENELKYFNDFIPKNDQKFIEEYKNFAKKPDFYVRNNFSSITLVDYLINEYYKNEPEKLRSYLIQIKNQMKEYTPNISDLNQNVILKKIYDYNYVLKQAESKLSPEEIDEIIHIMYQKTLESIGEIFPEVRNELMDCKLPEDFKEGFKDFLSQPNIDYGLFVLVFLELHKKIGVEKFTNIITSLIQDRLHPLNKQFTLIMIDILHGFDLGSFELPINEELSTVILEAFTSLNNNSPEIVLYNKLINYSKQPLENLDGDDCRSKYSTIENQHIRMNTNKMKSLCKKMVFKNTYNIPSDSYINLTHNLKKKIDDNPHLMEEIKTKFKSDFEAIYSQLSSSISASLFQFSKKMNKQKLQAAASLDYILKLSNAEIIDPNSNQQMLTPQDLALLSLGKHLQNCVVGKTNGILEFYETYVQETHPIIFNWNETNDDAEQSNERSNEPDRISLLQQSTDPNSITELKLIDTIFLEWSTKLTSYLTLEGPCFKTLIHGDTSGDGGSQSVHFAKYFMNLIGAQYGLTKEIEIDLFPSTINLVTNIKPKILFDRFHSSIDLNEFIIETMESINRAHEQKTFGAGLISSCIAHCIAPEYLDSAFMIWDNRGKQYSSYDDFMEELENSTNQTDPPLQIQKMELSRIGTIGLLIKLGFLEKQPE
jgi:hypothetical protein